MRSQGDDTVAVRLDERPGGRVAYVTIDNPARHNAMGRALMAQFVEVMAELSRDDALRGVVLAGAGARAFIGGANIREMGAITTPHDAKAFIRQVQACCHAVRAVPVPVIARIQGFAFGAGLEIAASCDLRIASDAATFGMQEVRLGLPSVVEAALLPHLIGWGRARRLLLLGETIDARRAEAWGLVEEVVAPGALDAAVEACVGHLLECQPQAVRLQKQLMRAWEDLPVRAAIEAGVDAFGRAFEMSEPREAMAAFFAAKAGRKTAL